MKGCDLESELIREIQHGRHLVGTVAMHVNADLTLQHADERIVLQISSWRLWRPVVRSLLAGLLAHASSGTAFLLLVRGQVSFIFIPLPLILLCIEKRLTVTGDVSHASGRSLTFLAAIVCFWILPARHLHAVRRPRNFIA